MKSAEEDDATAFNTHQQQLPELNVQNSNELHNGLITKQAKLSYKY